MIRVFFNIIFVLLSFLTYNSYSQENCEVPLPPVLTSVSVQPETGKTNLSWTLSPSSNIAGYIIYSYTEDQGNRGDSITTIWDPAATSYSISSTVTKYRSAAYVVAAYRSPVTQGMDGCPSKFSNILNTIYTEADIDTCNYEILVKWNSYPSVPKKVIDYSIFLSVNGGSFSESGKETNDHNSYIIHNFKVDTEYQIIVRANLEDGTSSTSNADYLLTKMDQPPQWINANNATVDPDNNISLSFSADPLSEINTYKLERKTGETGSFEVISHPVALNGSVSFTDNQADPGVVNYYRLSAINNCSVPVTFSNICSNIVLSAERIGNDFNLVWNSYRDWEGMVSSYRIFLNTGNGYLEKFLLQPSDTVFTFGYQEIMYDITGDKICFYINATEISNPYSLNSQSISSEKCISPTEVITVPNIFTPDGDLVNDLFKPVLSFTPIDYHLVISNRHGEILFETRDPVAEWDGSPNGRSQPDRVCLWFLKVTTPSRKSISRSGTITIIHNTK